MPVTLSDPTITVNDDVVAIVPGSFNITEGLGEQKVLSQSVGGGKRVQVYSDNPAEAFSKVTFELMTTVANVALARAWKKNANNNVIGASESTTDGNFQRTFTQAALINDYDISFEPEGKIPLEFNANEAV